jgi:citrate lyase subunit beta/citryl-CoA lyase/(S)-citramalyl-CoA lyase
MAFRSFLFVPGSRPERFAKALAAGADAVCIDLEDAVGPADKDSARSAVAAFVRDQPARGLGVRINGLSTPHWLADCKALAGGGAAFVMIPKVEHADDVARVRQALGADAPPIWVIIESPLGLARAMEITAAEGLAGVLFGAADYSAEVGCTLEWDPLLYARGALAAAAAAGGVELLDVPYLDLSDDAGLRESTARVKAMGFTGRACIHPAQVAGVNAAFTPTPQEAARARRIVEAFDASGGGAAQLDGKLIELPVVLAARRTLERAEG